MNINQEPELKKNNSGSSTNIKVQNLTKSFSGITVLNDINLEFTSGEIHGLVGQNGAGKSTLGKIIGGHYRSSSGNIFLNNNNGSKSRCINVCIIYSFFNCFIIDTASCSFKFSKATGGQITYLF